MNKRLTSIVLCLVSLFLLRFSAYAAESPAVAVSSATAKTGEQVQIYLTLSGNTNFANLSIEVNYDSSALELVNVSNNTNFSALYFSSEYTSIVPYIMTWTEAKASGCNFNGTLASFTFKVLTEISGSYPITVDFYKGPKNDFTDGISINYNSYEEPLNLTYTNGKIDVIKENEIYVNINNSTVSFSSQHEVSGLVMTAFYDSSDRLLSMQSYIAETEVNATYIDNAATYAKIMWWEGYEPAPVCEAQTISLK